MKDENEEESRLSKVKFEAMELEEALEFEKALEKYRIAESILSVEDGSLEKYGNLLYEFGELEDAKKVFERLSSLTQDPSFLLRLADIYEQLDEVEKAVEIYRTLNNERKIDELGDRLKLNKPPEQVIKKFLQLFSGREDVFALQFEDGYRPIRRPMTVDDVANHLIGKCTLGAYVLTSDNNVNFGAYDVDYRTQESGIDSVSKLEMCKETVKNLHARLNYYNIQHEIEYSGNRGYHIWIFLDRPVPAYKVKVILEKILEQINISNPVSVEVFPKQSEHGGGLGNLIKLPLGIHRKTNRRCSFVDDNFEEIPKQLDYLLSIHPNRAEEIENLYRELYDQQIEQFEKDKNERRATRSHIRTQGENIKKQLRQQIHKDESDPCKTISRGCSILSQIITKIDQEAYITEEEERLLVNILYPITNSRSLITELLRRTINYSQPRLEILLSNSSKVPITCEEIKKEIVNSNIDLSLAKCTCKFSSAYNSPIAYLKQGEDKLFENVPISSVVKKIIDLNNEKYEIEKQIESLKNLLAKKMGDKQEEVTEWGRIIKKDGRIEIVL